MPLGSTEIADEQGTDLVKNLAAEPFPRVQADELQQVRFQSRAEAEKRQKNQHVVEIKEIRMSPGIDIGDFNTKLKNAQEVHRRRQPRQGLGRFRGREMAHTDIGRDLLDRFAAQCAKPPIWIKPAKLEGRMMSIFLSPKSGK